MAMGGAGVASAKPYNASFFNPALLRNEDLGWSNRWFMRVSAGARLIDRDDFLDTLDSYQNADFEGHFEQALDNFNSKAKQLTLTFSDARNLLSATQNWADGIESLSNKPLRVSGAALFNIGRPGESVGFGLFARRRLVLGSVIQISDADMHAIDDSISFLNTIVDIADTGVVPEELQLELPHIPEDLTSFVEVKGADYQESGVALAFDLISHQKLQFGVNIKQLSITTVHFREQLDDADLADFDRTLHQATYEDVNLDLGLSGKFGANVRWGLVAQNILTEKYQSVLREEIKFSPIVRAGLSYESKHVTYTLDYDLTKNDPLGFDPNKQFISAGTEIRLWANTAVRFGYRYNRVDKTYLLSSGVGVGFEYGHLDLALANKGDELGASMQFALHF